MTTAGFKERTMHDIDKRRHQRSPEALPGRLFLQQRKGGETLAGPEPCTLRDISAGGAGISVARIFLETHHLFYTPQEDPAMVLMLEFTVPDENNIILKLTVRPVWFDLDENQDFLLGVEFAEPPAEGVLDALAALCAGTPVPGRTWLHRLVARFRDGKNE